MPKHYRSYPGRTNQGDKAPIAKATTLNMRFVTDVVINPAVGVALAHVFRANSINQPDFTAASAHQPYGHDQWAVFYNNYVVFRSLCTAQFTTVSTGTAGHGIVGIGLRDLSTTDLNPDTIRETPNSAYRGLGATNGANNIAIVRKSFEAKHFFSTPNPQDDDNQRTVFGLNPLKDAFFHVFAMDTDPAGNLDPVNVQVTITYSCVLSEPKSFAGS